MNAVYLLAWISARSYFSTYHRWRIFNRERVPVDGPVILASNHESVLDPPLLGCSLPRTINYLAKESLFKLPVCGWFLNRLQAVPVDREGGGGRGLKMILDRLLRGGGIILFPEGTRTRTGRLQPARAGIGLVVLKSTAPVVPVRVFGTYRAFGPGRKLPRPVRITVKYGHPMSFETLRAEAKACPKQKVKDLYQQVADELMRKIAGLLPCKDVDRFP